MTNRFVCIHGHFYQPPREHPWLESIEVQDSAYPFHDWNERITAECYAPNALSRTVDAKGRILRLVNNYARISFNFGPTLLSWLDAFAPTVYQGILEADRASRERFGGHGSALAQPYNHAIMPLASPRDQETQVIWGIHDFKKRFGRDPEGMWLPETAVDMATLECLAKHGIKFTILAPHQARRIRPIGSDDWTDVTGARIDGKVPYLCRLKSGRSIILFFYDGPASRAVAFERLLDNGESLTNRLIGLLPHAPEQPVLAHIATDGESYGHHHRHGDMALAWALQTMEARNDIQITNYAQFLDLSPPRHEVELIEETSWSCAHGVERWRGNCGCSSGREGWNQEWRGPLRQSLDWLRDGVEPFYEAAANEFLRDAWAARDDYIGVILDRSPASVNAFLQKHAKRPLSQAERVRVLRLLELQRQALLMYTSCGWFFDELSGIETVQVLAYAGRCVQLAEELFGRPFEEEFLKRLKTAPSNVARYGNGRRIYEALVRPARVDLRWVAAHFAFTSMFQTYDDRARVHCFDVVREEGRTLTAGRAKLGLGRLKVRSRVTEEEAGLTYAAVHLGDHNLHGGVRFHHEGEAYAQVHEEIANAFEHARLPDVIGLVNKHFGENIFSVRQLFRDEQRRIVHLVQQGTYDDFETSFGRLYERCLPLVRFLTDLQQPLPREFRIVSEFVINRTLLRAFEGNRLDVAKIEQLLAEAQRDGLALESAGLAYGFQRHLERLYEELAQSPKEIERLEAAAIAAEVARILPFDVSLWRSQNAFYSLLETAYPEQQAAAKQGDEIATRWLAAFTRCANDLNISVPEP